MPRQPNAGRERLTAAVIVLVPLIGQLSGLGTFDVVDTKGHQGDRVLFSKWNSFSRIGVYERAHGDWSLSPTYSGAIPDTKFMDIDSAASTPIPRVAADLSNVGYLRYELTALAYHLKSGPGTAGRGTRRGAGRQIPAVSRRLSSDQAGDGILRRPSCSGLARVDAVEINPIIANDVMRGAFRDFSGRIYDHPRVRIAVDDGRSFVRRSPDKYDVIQASLVDTWAATAAGAYTLTENTLYTVEAFTDYLDHLTDDGVLTITRWVFDGLRLVSLAQEAAARRGWDAAPRLAIIQHDRVATFLLKKSPFTAEEVSRLQALAERLQFRILYAPGSEGPIAPPAGEWVEGTETAAYANLISAPDRQQFYASYEQDIRPTTDDRPFFFHTTKLEDQFDVAFGRSMLFGNGLSALLTLMGISAALVAAFVIGPLVVAGGDRPSGWPFWLVYFGALGAGFMLIEVAILQRFVLLLGHPVYSLTVTLFSLLLGTGIGAALSRRLTPETLRRSTAVAILVIVALGLLAIVTVAPFITWAIPFSRPVRIAVAVATLVPIGMVLGIPMPAGIRLLTSRAPQMLTWAWGMNGALSVVGATLAIFIAMNWGFSATFVAASSTYLVGLAALLGASR